MNRFVEGYLDFLEECLDVDTPQSKAAFTMGFIFIGIFFIPLSIILWPITLFVLFIVGVWVGLTRFFRKLEEK